VSFYRIFIYLFLTNYFQRRPIVYGSKVALVHVSTGKYLSTKGVKYNDHHKQKMVFTTLVVLCFSLHYYVSRRTYTINFIYEIAKVICNGQKIDLNNDVWTVDEGYNTEKIRPGSLVKFNSTVGFKRNAKGEKLHSHRTCHGTTLKSNHQQGILG